MNTEIFITEMINTKIIIRKILITKIMKNIGIKRIISFRTFFFAQKFDAGLVSKHKKKLNEQKSVWCQINWQKVIPIQIWLDLTRFRKDLFLCS